MNRQIKDIKDKNTGQLVYPRTHIKAVVIDESTNLEDLIGTNVGERLNTLEETISDKLDKTEAASTYATKTELENKQDITLKFSNKTASVWVSDSTYQDYPYRCDIACDGVTADMYAEVVFELDQSTSGNYAPICETKTNIVSIWSNDNTEITIPTIIITK